MRAGWRIGGRLVLFKLKVRWNLSWGCCFLFRCPVWIQSCIPPNWWPSRVRFPASELGGFKSLWLLTGIEKAQQTLNEFSSLCANADFSMYLCSSCLHLAPSRDFCSVEFSWILFSEIFQLGMAISADKPEINAILNGLMQFLLRANGRPVLALQSGGFEARLCI